MANRIHLGDWDAVTDELRRFGEAGDVTTGDDRIRIDFERRGAVGLVVDHDAGSLTIDADDVTYTFRRPGG